jgi:DNA-binding transcriptional ArsR family regulator
MSDGHEALAVLGDPTRQRLMEVLSERPRSVAELAAQVPVSRPAVSQHLKVLQGAGLVTHEPVGTRHLYRVDPGGLAEVRAYLDGLWDAVLSGFAEAARPFEDAAEVTQHGGDVA